jgi:hypothetical protein|tara:strand:+ start:102 stop:482 length:381 start_codon:yes stop_codon:yes gene_type:complete
MIERIDLIEHKLDYPTFKIKRFREWLNDGNKWLDFDDVKEATKFKHDEERLLANKGLVDLCREWNSNFSWKGEADDLLVAGALEIYRTMKRKGVQEHILAKHIDIDNLMRFAKKEVKDWADNRMPL